MAYTARINLMITAKQYRWLRDVASEEGRDVPNLLRRLIDLALAQKERGGMGEPTPPQRGRHRQGIEQGRRRYPLR